MDNRRRRKANGSGSDLEHIRPSVRDFRHIDIAPGNLVVLGTKVHPSILGDFSESSGVSGSDAIEPHNLNRVLHGSSDGNGRPLPMATFLRSTLVFLPRQNRDSIIGDLEERYSAILQHEGRRAATRWFWQEVIHSCFSLALDALKRTSGFEKLIERYRRIGS